MAFPVPKHLPRAPKSKDHDISSSILNKIAETKAFDAPTASGWVAELDDAVQTNKRKIYERIHEDLLLFKRQLETSKSVQKRLVALRTNVDEMSTEFDDPEQGILPKVLRTMRTHSTLVQQERHANILNQCLQHLLRCKNEYTRVEALLNQGRIPEVVAVVDPLMQLIRTCPPPLDVSKVVIDLKTRARALKDNAQEQLARAYAQSIDITGDRFSVHSQYSEHLSLASIFSSIPEDTLSTNLTSLRKDILSNILNPLISGNVSASLESSSTLTLTPAETRQLLPSIRTLFSFIYTQILSHLPTTHQISFASSFYVPLTTSLTTHVLTPAIPDSVSRLPAFLTLVKDVVQLEQEISDMGFMAGKERRIFEWSRGARGHYERTRRAELIEKARFLVLQPSRGSFRVEVEMEAQLAEVVDLTAQQTEQTVDVKVEKHPKPEPELEIEVDTTAWDFEEGEENKEETKAEQNDDGWGFGDDGETNAEPTSSTDVNDDDPWAQEWNDPNEVKPPSPPPKQLAASAARTGQPSAPIQKTAKTAQKESYLVSQVARALASIAEDVLREGSELLDSSVFADHGLPSTSSTLVLSTSPAIFDLFRALYPVSRAAELEQNIATAVEYANDCRYLAEQTRKVASCINIRNAEDAEGLRGKFEDVAEKLEIIGESWMQEVIDRETRALKTLLAKADRFVGMSVDVRFHHAQDTMTKILERVHHTSAALKLPMTMTAFYTALGSTINDLLARVLKEVLRLRDIPEVESQRLAALCRILHPLDELFIESADEVSSVAMYVPLWLKFTYLSDILEGTLAEISAWFDAGHLIDYEIHELNSLLVALFSETPMRAETITKFSRGHPQSGY